LRISNVTKRYGAEPVLLDVNFTLSPRESLGLVGPNGSGKSTLLRIAAGELAADSGSVWLDPASRVGYLPQYPLDELDLTVRDALVAGTGRVGELQQRLLALEDDLRIASGATLDAALEEYAQTRDEFERLDGYALAARIEAVVAGLGVDVPDLDAPVRALSAGNKTKLSLARLLLSQADIVLLDEPTNFLDLHALLWLERYVSVGDRSYLIVSHDRRFLDRTAAGILEIDPDKHTVRAWPGNYTDYLAAREAERARHLDAYRQQQERVNRIEADIRRAKEQARGVERRVRSGMGADVQRRLAKKVARKAKARERRLERDLEREAVEKPKQGWGLHLRDLGRDAVAPRTTALEVEDLRAGYNGSLLLRGIDLLIRGGDRVALLGRNGSGKTTLLRCVQGTLPYSGRVSLGPGMRTGVLAQEADTLPPNRTVLEVFRSAVEVDESAARTYLHRFLFAGDEPLKRVVELSYGQRAKLALALLVLSSANFLILDEPTSHLDGPALEAIEQALREFPGPMLVVSHDRYFLDRIGVNRAVVLESGRLREVNGIEDYEREIWTAV
jgi:ATP-binding cassette subfamily F protein 3